MEKNKITLQVYFMDDVNLLGNCVLIENLITNDVQLELSRAIFLHEIYALVDKAIDILKKRCLSVDVKINWDR